MGRRPAEKQVRALRVASPHEGTESASSSDIADAIVRALTGPDLDGSLRSVLATAVRALGGDHGAVLRKSGPPSSRLTALAVTPGAERPAGPLVLDASDRRLLQLLNGGDAVVVIEDADSVLPSEWGQSFGRSIVAAPLRAFDATYGLLIVGFSHGNVVLAEGKEPMLLSLAAAVAARLHGDGLAARVNRTSVAAQVFAASRAALLSGGGLRETLDAMAGQLPSALPGCSFSISLLSPDRKSLRIVAFHGPPPPSEQIDIDALPVEGVRAAERFWSGSARQPLVIEDVHRYEGWERVVPPEIGPGMVAPLRAGGEVLGFVAIGRPNDPFTEEEIRVASAFADQAALAVAQAKLTEALKGRMQAAEALLRLSDVVLRTSSLKGALTSLNRGVGSALGVRCVRVRFSDPQLSTMLSLPEPNEAERSILRTWRSPARGRSRQSSSPLPLPVPADIGGTIAVPIPIQNRVTGILWIRTRGDLDHAAMEFVQAIAAGIGDVAYKAKLRRTGDRRAQALAVADERERIAQDLHENVGEVFFALCLKLQDLLAEATDEESIARLGEARALAARGLADMRSAVFALSSLHVRSRGFVPAIRALIRQFSRDSHARGELRVEGRIAKLPQEVESALFRLLHEALLNVDRHSRATGVVVTLAWKPGEIRLRISDDGVGLDQRQVADWRSAAHFGMRNMARSIEAVGGTFRVTNARPRGLLIQASVPIRAGRRQ